MSRLEDLERLGKMLDEGKIDRAEYDQLKAELLDQPTLQSDHPIEHKAPGWTGYTRPPPIATESIRKLTDFEIWFKYGGRISVGQYWAHFGVLLLAFTVLGVAVINLGQSGPELDALAGFLIFVVIVLAVWTNTALGWKRLHDQGREGTLYLLVFIPFGVIVWLIFSFQAGTDGPNKYGPEPGYRWA